MKKIILAGASLSSGNRGVNALTRAQIYLGLEKYGENTDIMILSYAVESEVIHNVEYKGKVVQVKEVPVRLRELAKSYMISKVGFTNKTIDLIKSVDYVWDVTEGDSFSDIYGIKRFLHYSLIKLIAIKCRTKLIIMPQTLGPFKNSLVKMIAKRILSKADFVFVRDEISKKIVKDELGIDREVIYIPDMAFYMLPSSKVSLDNFVDNDYKVKVGINISALLYNGGYNGKNMFNLKADYKELIDTLISKLLMDDKIEIILIPHVLIKELEVEDDFSVCKSIANRFNNKSSRNLITLDKYYREDELKAIISGCDFFIGSRMHACIGAISTNVPTAPIAYSRKFIGIWEKIGLGECVTDPREQTESEIIENILKSFNDKERIKNKLNLEIPLLKNQIEKIVDIIEEK